MLDLGRIGAAERSCTATAGLLSFGGDGFVSWLASWQI